MKCITLFFSFCLIAIFSIAQPNYDFSKLKRERLGRGVIAIRENPLDKGQHFVRQSKKKETGIS